MVNQINLSNVNIRTLLLLILHDLPHDYKESRLEHLWKLSLRATTTQGGQKNKSKIVGGSPFFNTAISIISYMGGVPAAAVLAGLVAIGRYIYEDDWHNMEKKLDPELVNGGIEVGVGDVIDAFTEIMIKRNPATEDKLNQERNKIKELINFEGVRTRSATFRMQKLTELISILKMQMLNALSSGPVLVPVTLYAGGEGPPGLAESSNSSSDDSNQESSSRSKYPQQLQTPKTQVSNNEYMTPKTQVSNNEYMTPSSKEKGELLQLTSRPQTNKTNPPTVTTNRTKNKMSNNGTREKRRRTRRTRRTRRKTNRINKENDIRLKKNIAMNEIFINAFKIIFNGTKNNEIQDIITAFYNFYSMIKITSEISPLDVFDSSYVNSSLLIYLILKRSSFDVGLEDLKIIFETVFSSNNTFKGGESLVLDSDEMKNKVIKINEITKEIRKKLEVYYIGAKPLPKEVVPGDEMTQLMNHFKKDKTWDKTLIDHYNIKPKTIDIQLNTIKIKENIVNKSTAVKPYYLKLSDTINTLYLKIIFEHILIPIQKKAKQEKYKINLNYSADTPAKVIAVQNPHRLVSALVDGVFKYSGIREETSISLDKKFYNSEFSRLIMVGRGQGTYPNGETLDDRLLTSFKKYADDKEKEKKSPNDNWSILKENPTYNGNNKPAIINNGVILKNTFNNKLQSQDVTCTLSQRVDAMGTFGDCSTKIDVGVTEKNKETGLSHTTDIIIMGEEQEGGEQEGVGDYYASRMEEKKDSGNREIFISYSFKLGNLQTPVFFKTIDNSNPKIQDLSLTNTYKSVITRLLYIWATNTKLPEKYDEAGLKDLYDSTTKNEDMFIDLLLTSLQKGSGDNNQEWNSVFKYRGYTLPKPPKITDPINKHLLYVANDRPSAVRAMFTLINGTGDINNNVTAGFPSGEIYITRPAAAAEPIASKNDRQINQPASKNNRQVKTTRK
jgi:hypothetical protein